MDEVVLRDFLAESWEHLERLDTEIVAMERDPNNAALLENICQRIHAFKETCGFLGLIRLGTVTNAIENVLGRMRQGTLPATGRSISLLRNGVDCLKELLHGLETTGKEPIADHGSILAALNQLSAQDGSPSPAQSVRSTPLPARTTNQSDAVRSELPSATSPASSTIAGTTANAVTVPTDKETGSLPVSREPMGKLAIPVGIDVLERIKNLVGELAGSRDQLAQDSVGDAGSTDSSAISHLDRVTVELQKLVKNTRMPPVREIVQQRQIICEKGSEIEIVGASRFDITATEAGDWTRTPSPLGPCWYHRCERGEQVRVLVLDGSLFFRQLATTTLEEAGLSVVSCGDPLEGLDRLERGEKFDVIISELSFPGISESEFMEAVAGRLLEEKTPLIALTGLPAETHRERALRAGFRKFLIKFSAQQFVAAVEEVAEESLRVQNILAIRVA